MRDDNRQTRAVGITLPVLAAALVVAGCSAFSAPGYRGETTSNFDGETFLNLRSHDDRSFWQWQMTGEQGEWPDWVEIEPAPPPPKRVEEGIRITRVNHSTMLIQVDGLNILTDPIWSYRCSPLSWVGPRRHHRPGVRFEDLPPIDVVVISHNHYDHLDVETLRRLDEAHSPEVFAGLGNGALFRKESIGYTADMNWWDARPLSDDITLHAVPAQHFSGRGLDDRNETLWMGFVIEAPSGNIYFAGDTGWGPHFQEIRDRFGEMRLALLPIGAYKPRWFMGPMHISPAEAVRAHFVLGAEKSAAIHYGTFALGDDGYRDPERDLSDALGQTALTEDDFWSLGAGEHRAITGPRRR